MHPLRAVSAGVDPPGRVPLAAGPPVLPDRARADELTVAPCASAPTTSGLRKGNGPFQRRQPPAGRGGSRGALRPPILTLQCHQKVRGAAVAEVGFGALACEPWSMAMDLIQAILFGIVLAFVALAVFLGGTA